MFARSNMAHAAAICRLLEWRHTIRNTAKGKISLFESRLQQPIRHCLCNLRSYTKAWLSQWQPVETCNFLFDWSGFSPSFLIFSRNLVKWLNSFSIRWRVRRIGYRWFASGHSHYHRYDDHQFDLHTYPLILEIYEMFPGTASRE